MTIGPGRILYVAASVACALLAPGCGIWTDLEEQGAASGQDVVDARWRGLVDLQVVPEADQVLALGLVVDDPTVFVLGRVGETTIDVISGPTEGVSAITPSPDSGREIIAAVPVEDEANLASTHDRLVSMTLDGEVRREFALPSRLRFRSGMCVQEGSRRLIAAVMPEGEDDVDHELVSIDLGTGKLDAVADLRDANPRWPLCLPDGQVVFAGRGPDAARGVVSVGVVETDGEVRWPAPGMTRVAAVIGWDPGRGAVLFIGRDPDDPNERAWSLWALQAQGGESQPQHLSYVNGRTATFLPAEDAVLVVDTSSPGQTPAIRRIHLR